MSKKPNFSLTTREEFSIFVTHYPRNTPIDRLLVWLNLKIEEKFDKKEIRYSNKTLLGDGITFDVDDKETFQQILSLNGEILKLRSFDVPIWILSLPGPLTFLAPTISSIYSTFIQREKEKVLLDLSSLSTKFLQLNANPENVDFQNRWFNEYLFFRIGHEDDSSDNKEKITHLNITKNNIYSLRRWAKFFVFLPELEEVIVDLHSLNELPDPSETKIRFVTENGRGSDDIPWDDPPPASNMIIKSTWKIPTQNKDDETNQKWNKNMAKKKDKTSFGEWGSKSDKSEKNEKNKNTIQGSWGTPVASITNYGTIDDGYNDDDDDDEADFGGW